MNKKNNHEFCCPNQLPAPVAEERFYIPCDCPQQLHTVRYSSPNSSLPPMELEKLKALLEHLNSILLSVASEKDTENLSGLRIHFRKLRGLMVRVKIECDNSPDSIVGCLVDVGSDYIEIDSVCQHEFVPFSKLCSISHHDSEVCQKPHMHEPELQDIDSCLRRELVLNFGEVVSSNPKLFQIFFGLPLHLRLLQEINCSIEVQVNGENDIIKGLLVNTKINEIEVKLNCSKTNSMEDNILNKEDNIINKEDRRERKKRQNVVEKGEKDIEQTIDNKYKSICLEDICYIRVL